MTGDLGRSFAHGVPALELILNRASHAWRLAFVAMLLVGTGIPLGLIAGLRPNSVVSKTIMAGSILGFSLPTFWGTDAHRAVRGIPRLAAFQWSW